MTRAASSLVFVVVLSIAACAACGRDSHSSAAAAASVIASLPEVASAPLDPLEAAAWQHARDGDEADYARLADKLGCAGLRERAADGALRLTAIRAMGYCGDLSEVAWLASMAVRGSEEERTRALDSVLTLVASRRRVADPEDADQVAAGCRVLTALAADGSHAREERAKAASALRMLSDRGCASPGEIPDLDVADASP